jgi:hypothetical protein
MNVLKLKHMYIFADNKFLDQMIIRESRNIETNIRQLIYPISLNIWFNIRRALIW